MGAEPRHAQCSCVGHPRHCRREVPMRNFLLTICVGAVAVFATGAAHANDDLIKMSQNPKDWVMPTGNDAKILWKYEPKQDPNVIPVMCCDTVNRGLAYADGKIFLHQADTTLVALDAKDGKVVWQAKNGDPAKGETGTSAPMVIKDKVL